MKSVLKNIFLAIAFVVVGNPAKVIKQRTANYIESIVEPIQ